MLDSCFSTTTKQPTMMFFTTLLLCAFAAVSLASEEMQLLGRGAPNGWRALATPVDANTPFEFRLALTQSAVGKQRLAAETLTRADPEHKLYGQWLTKEEVLDLVAPPLAVTQKVVEWVESQGLEADGSGRDVVIARGSVAQVEAALRTKLELWEHESGRVRRIRTLRWSLPAALTPHVELLSGLSEFWLPKKKAKRIPAVPGNSVKAGYVIPDTVRRLYGMPKDNFRDVSKASSICLAEFQDDASFDKSDLAYFDQQTGEASSHVDHIVGPYSPGVPDAESLLDVELASTLALNSTYWFWTVTGWMYEFSTDLFKRKDGPHVVSMSWGWSSSDQCSITSCNGTTSRQYIERVDTEFNKITATGVTLLAASGDQGAPGDAHGDSCDGLGTIYPGASQWVTSVGATMLDERSKPSPPPPPPYKAPPVCSQFPCSNVMYEMACSIPTALITTGGGFNIYTLRPNWQNNAVLEYLNSSVKFPPQHMWHSANRGFPDVSAVGHAILIADQGQMEQVDGTSASSPIVASMVALWNGYRLNNKKSTLGFINPALYKAWEKDKAAFKPTKYGNNKCSENCCGHYGYEPNPNGWSAVTGLGTISFPHLLNYFASLP